MEFTLSKKPLQNNSTCASCGRVFSEEGLSLRFDLDGKVIDFPLCQRCFDTIPRFDAAVNPETGAARVKR